MPEARPAAYRILAVLAALAVLLAPLAVVSDYNLFRLTLVASYALALLGLNLVMGFGGQISLGHGAFYAVGGYTTAILVSVYDVPYWATFPAVGAGLRRTRLPDRLAGAAAHRPLSRAGHARARRPRCRRSSSIPRSSHGPAACRAWS